MDQFEYVMVLVSIIVGLGIANILLGIGAIVDRVSRKEGRLEPSWAHAMWLLYCFTWLVMFWWWEYRFSSESGGLDLGLVFISGLLRRNAFSHSSHTRTEIMG